jgi:GWxTD domain-containing protein
LLALVALAPAWSVIAAKSELEKWIDGPIRYIARKDEAKMFRSLETDEARSIFIARFWRRRDPVPETLTNEYRELFWQRVQQANDSFLDSSKQGWMTDRGKIWILYGPPTDVEDYHELQANDSRGRGVLRWIYQGRPGERMDLDPVVVVPFERGTDGEYRVSYDPKLASVFFDANAIAEGKYDAFDQFLSLMGSPRQTELSVMLDLGRMQEVPPAEEVLIESVETMEAYATLDLPVQVNRFFDPDEQRPVAVVNVDLSQLEPSDNVAILARFDSLSDEEQEPRLLGEDSFKLGTSGEYRLAQGRLSLDPGDYRLTVVVADPINVKTALHKSEFQITGPPKTLRFSDTVWALEMAEVRYGSLASYDEPFHIGPFRVLPKLDSVFHIGETVRLFVQVYGAEYPIRASYQLEGREEDGSWVALGDPAVVEQTAGGLAWEVGTDERWPLGSYRVRVDVTDAAERLISTDAEFSLERAERADTTAATE